MFIDTSSLFKKYFQEQGSEAVIDYFKKSTKVCVAPITYIEVTNSSYRFYKNNSLTKKELTHVTDQINADFRHFTEVSIDTHFNSKAIDAMKKYSLKALDLIHLISARVSNSKLFLTSDKQLYKVAKSYLRCDVKLV